MLESPPRQTSWASRHGYAVIGFGLVAIFMAMFVVAEQLRIPLLTEPRAYLDDGTWPVALGGFALLVADVLLPVPASGVMIAQGALFGLVLGSVLSLLGGTAATLAGYLVGRRSRRLVEKFVSEEQRERGAALLERHGAWAIVVTRPVPMLAETTAILAGASGSVGWWKATLAGAAGNVVPAVGYAAVGAYAATFVNAVSVFVGVLAVALVVWLVQRRLRPG